VAIEFARQEDLLERRKRPRDRHQNEMIKPLFTS
jgi:hypothetical protein